jgi:uncharacterized protein (TIGR02147 family)
MKRTEDQAPAIESFLDYRAWLDAWLTWKKRTSPRFSHRAFARRMGQKSPSVGADLVAGRRNLTDALLGPLAKSTELDADGRQYLALLVALDRARSAEERAEAWERIARHRRFREARKLEADGMRYVSDWVCPAIRELAQRSDFVPDPSWVAKTLTPAVSEARARSALQVVFDLGLLEEGPDGRVRPANAAVVTPPEVRGIAARSFHRGIFDLAKEGLERFSAPERHYTGITVCVPTALVPQIKRDIQSFAEQMLDRCDGTGAPAERVYQIHVAAFPLSNSMDPDT